MSRVINVTVIPDQRDDILNRIEGVAGVAGISVHYGASLMPPGDIVSVQASSDATRAVLAQLGEAGVLSGAGTVVLSEPTALLAPSSQELVDNERTEAIWEEIAALLRRDTNVGVNFLLLMAAAGAIAAVGIVEGTIHIVVGAMLLAPGFEPFMRIVFGAMSSGQGTGVASGIRATAYGYAVLAAAAAALAVALSLLGRLPAGGLSSLPLVQYWITIGPPGVIVSVLAAVAGAAVLTSRRTVFAAGVMVALALVPGAAIAGMALVLGDVALAACGGLRWAVDASCVLVAGGSMLALKRFTLHRRHVED
ncbi:MAG TPA: DUF389 domain-containing protein [Rhodospirillales bacterium]|jgi:hypothetical protein|nr:DUF389 domain-containing protein [Rhodospirillales bacterium]